MSEFFRSCRDSDIALAPCPICGSASELWELKRRQEATAVKVVICANREPLEDNDEGCLLLIPPERFYRSTLQEAADVWNDFAAAAELSRKDKELEKIAMMTGEK